MSGKKEKQVNQSELRLKKQNVKSFVYTVFLEHDNRYAVTCDYSYTWDDNSTEVEHNTAILLIKLNRFGECIYYYQVDQVRPW